MGKSSPSVPAPPDPTATAAAQSQASGMPGSSKPGMSARWGYVSAMLDL